ncbi:MAG: HAD-IIB family hydrolase [Campylobacterales bacterium]|nr:HAD-IIB family hydrolase [Campylobacterales bacterium]
MKKIFITDLDHTFLRTDLSLSAYTKSIWNHRHKEAVMGIATARTYKKTMQFLEGVRIDAPMILLDGALIATVQGEILHTCFMVQELSDEVIAIGGRLGIWPFILALGKQGLHERFIYPKILNDDQRAVLRHYDADDHLECHDALRAGGSEFKLVYMGQEAPLRALEAELKAHLGDALRMTLAPEAYNGCYFLAVLPPNADKAHGIAHVLQHYDARHLSVFGDNLNDLGMFAYADVAVAVANAHEELKRRAHVVLEHTNDEDAVARYLEEHAHAYM